MLHVQESVNLTIYLYAQTMGHRRMLYIRKFYVVKNIYKSIYIHRWDTGTELQWRVTNMARKDLSALGGGAGGREAPPQQLMPYNLLDGSHMNFCLFQSDYGALKLGYNLVVYFELVFFFI